MTAPPPDDTTTNLHVVIAALRAERDAAVAREAKRDSDYAERAAHQEATAEVLEAMTASPGDPKPVFEVIVRRARDLCDGYGVSLAQVVDNSIVLQAYIVADEALGKRHEAGFPHPVTGDTIFGRAILAREPVQIPDVAADETFALRESTLIGAVRALVAVPLMRDGEAIGAIDIARRQTGEFAPAQIELLQVLANQAVIAINSAETYRALQTRTADLQESLEYQTATSDVLKVISRSTFDLQPVLETLVETAARLCEADQATIVRPEGDLWRTAANIGFPPEYLAYYRSRGGSRYGPDVPSVAARAVREKVPVHIHDAAAVPGYPGASISLGKQRTSLGVPLLREGEAIGIIVLARQRVEPFTDRQIELVSTFANQAVIAIENTRLITEQREALEHQTATAEVLQVINVNPGNLTPVFEAILDKAHSLCDVAVGSLSIYLDGFVHTAAMRGFSEEYQALLRRPYPAIGSHRALMRGGPSTQTLDFRTVPVSPEMASSLDHLERMNLRTGLWVPLRKDGTALGCISSYRDKVQPFSEKEIALLENFAAQAVIAMENARLLGELHTALDTTQATLNELKIAQANLIQAEKMASLGQLTAGIAHEIKNPLNFVNNFAALSVDLLGELKETAAPGLAVLTDDQRAEIDDVTAMLTSNLEKITEHGKRADGIVKAMLEHSRGSSAERRMVDLNVLIDEALNLAYHGARAQDQSFNITLEREFGEGITPIEVNPQDMTRVFLNIFSNGFYAATRRARNGGDAGFAPRLKVTTHDAGEVVEIRVRDNGTGIPAEIRDKLFQPFFTTKPTGEGTGLGLSITYDIVTKQHGGTIAVDSEIDEFTEFVITLPRQMFAIGGDRV